MCKLNEALSIENLVIANNDICGDLIIAGYEQLESITVKAYAIQNIRSLSIVNNPQLKNLTFNDCACEYVTKVKISSLIQCI